MTGISYVVTCKGRLHHLRKTLPVLADLKAHSDEIIVVDYDCPENAGDWVASNFEGVDVVRVENRPFFNPGDARNRGFDKATNEWVVFVDADVKLSVGFCAWVKTQPQPGAFYRAGKNGAPTYGDMWGTCVVHRDAVSRIGGYDIVFPGWGGEDDDLYARLRYFGYVENFYLPSHVEAVPHDDNERHRFRDLKDKQELYYLNWLYVEAKSRLMHQSRVRGPLDLRTRRYIMERIQKSVHEWISNGMVDDLSISFDSEDRGWLPKPHVMKIDSSFTITVVNR